MRNRNWILLSVYVLLLNFVGLGSHGLFEPDEGRYSNMAFEWLEFDTHGWAEPVLADIGHFDKPPMIYWVTGTCLHFFGMNEIAARLPSFLGSLLALLGVGLIAFRQYGEKMAFWSVLVCATTLQFWALAHLLSPDMLLCGFCTLGAALTLWGGRGAKGWLIWSLGALFWSLAWWTKATAALVPLGAISGALLISGRKDLLAAIRPIRLLLLILVLGSPWYIVMMMKHDELKDFFLHREVVGRVVGHEDGRKGFLGFHFVVALGFWLPWWPVLLHRLVSARPSWQPLNWKVRIRNIPWEFTAAILVLLIYSCVSSKLITYTLPGAPFLALAVGAVLSKVEFSFRKWPAQVVAGMTVLLMVVISSVSHFENSLGSNSSPKQAVLTAKANGAQWLICDDFLPGVQFYAGESVLYVDVKDIGQVEELPGQNALEHFIAKDQIRKLVRETDVEFWLIRTRDKLLSWESHLIDERPNPEVPPIVVGDFSLYRIK